MSIPLSSPAESVAVAVVLSWEFGVAHSLKLSTPAVSRRSLRGMAGVRFCISSLHRDPVTAALANGDSAAVRMTDIGNADRVSIRDAGRAAVAGAAVRGETALTDGPGTGESEKEMPCGKG